MPVACYNRQDFVEDYDKAMFEVALILKFKLPLKKAE